jgi:flagellar motor switch protein FliM
MVSSEKTVPESEASAELRAQAKWPVMMQVGVPLAVRIPLPGVSLRGLATLVVGTVIASEWPVSEEVPLYAAGVALSWCEFDVVDGAIAVRLTRLQ